MPIRTPTISRASVHADPLRISRRLCFRRAVSRRQAVRSCNPPAVCQPAAKAYHCRDNPTGAFSVCSTFPMLDLGLSFLGSVARDPGALAVVDGDVRLSYAQWYRRISALVAGFDAVGLKPGDHLVTALTNRWEAPSLHWACQFTGIIIAPVNWRSTASEIDFYLEAAEAKAVVYEDASATAVA